MWNKEFLTETEISQTKSSHTLIWLLVTQLKISTSLLDLRYEKCYQFYFEIIMFLIDSWMLVESDTLSKVSHKPAHKFTSHV